MKQPVDGTMDERAPYVALSRATALEKLYMVEPITLDQLRHKPKADIAATLDFLDRLDKATQAVFFDKPSEFTPVTVNSVGNVGHRNGGDLPSGHERPGTDSGSGPAGDGRSGPSSSTNGPPTPTPIFLAPNSRNNCFFNAAVACTLAAYDGQPLLCEESSTPSARVFFSAIGYVRDNMHGRPLPASVLVRYDFRFDFNQNSHFSGISLPSDSIS